MITNQSNHCIQVSEAYTENISEDVPDGFKLNDVGIYYYLNYSKFNLSMKLIREGYLKKGSI